jgi:protein SCO1/2
MNMLRLAVPLALMLAACSPSQPGTQAGAEPPLAGARIGGPFALTDQDGRRVTDRDFAGRWRIMYFGYTFCPDVCPTGLQNLAAGLKAFEKSDAARAAKVVPVFVTVDPTRDTPAVMKSYVTAFHPRLVGLTGDEAAIAAVAKAYGVYAARGELQPGGGYLVDHSAQAYLMDPDGKPVALLPSEGPPQKVAEELAKWVK